MTDQPLEGIISVHDGVTHFQNCCTFRCTKSCQSRPKNPFRYGTPYRKLLICMISWYCLANFKTAGFNRSPTPPLLILTHLSGECGFAAA